MQKITEKQQLSENRPVVILMVAIMFPILILMTLALMESGSLKSEAALALGINLLMSGVIFFFVFRMKTMVSLSPKGVHYKGVPFQKGLRLIPESDIASLGIVQHKWWYGFGYRFSFSGERILAMKPGSLLKVVTKSGKKYLFGVNRVKLIERFIQEHWPNIPFNVK
jgi:hypothetical protein